MEIIQTHLSSAEWQDHCSKVLFTKGINSLYVKKGRVAKIFDDEARVWYYVGAFEFSDLVEEKGKGGSQRKSLES